MVEISTSVLGVKEENAVKTFFDLETAHTDYFHIDVMDGKFVEKDTTKKMLKYAGMIKQISNLPLDVHFMVENIEENMEEYFPLEPRILTFHLEAVTGESVEEKAGKVKELIQKVKDNHCKVGISIKPNTKIEEIYPFLPFLHLVLVMTVEPGKGGQELIPETLQKIKELKQYREEQKLDFEIEADGGINYATIEEVKAAGVDIVVAGTAIIAAKDYKSVIEGMRE